MARKQRQQATADDILRQMYPDLPTSEDFGQPKQAAATDAEASPGDKSQIVALQAQIAAMEGRIAATARANAALQSQATTDMPPVKPTIDYNQAPDPVDDKNAYTKFMLDAQNKMLQYEKDMLVYEQRRGQAAAQKTSGLWSNFKTKHDDYAKDEERLVIATQQVIARAKQAGMDTDRYMHASSDQFMEDVTKEYDRLFGKPGEKPGADDDEEGDDDTSLEMLGGGVGGATTGARGKAPPQRYGDLSQEVLAWQEKTGFRR